MSKWIERSLWISPLLVALLVPSSRAADIDLFAGLPTGNGAPSVLFVLDNAANFSASVTTQRCSITVDGVVKTDGTGTNPTNLDKTSGAVEQCALYAAIQSLTASATATLKIGVMGFNDQGMKQFNAGTNTFSSDCNGNTGGCLLMPIVPLTPEIKANILDWIRKWEISGNSSYNIKANNNANGAAMQEAWAYLKGKTGVSGRNYNGISPQSNCGNTSIVFIGNAYRNNATPGDSTNETNSPYKPLAGTSADIGKRADPPANSAEKTVISDTITTQCGTSSLKSGETNGIYALNWAKYIRRTMGVTTYSVGVLGPTCNAEYAAHLTKLGAADLGGGKFFPTNNFEELKVALQNIFSEVQAVNSVFSAVSLPVSVNTQGTYLNQVYIGMFRPDKDSRPRWNGNLKQYRLGKINNALRLVDASADPGMDVINPLTGFVTECAQSYWTPSSVDSYWPLNNSDYYWSLDNVAGCVSVANSKVSNYPDGNIVEKGAQAYLLRGLAPSARSVKTCAPVFANCTSLTDFSTGNSAVTGVLSNDVINWARGQNIDNELGKGTSVVRPSVHGDVLHSRPVPINYGTDASPDIVVFYGGNDGVLRAINGNRSSSSQYSVGVTTKTFVAGAELWSFIPPEFYGKLQRLRDNSPPISYPGSIGGTDKDYGIDGPLTSYANGATRYLFAPMRRGGRVVYAFNVSNPANPSLLWKKGCPNGGNDTDCSTGFSGIGQTWTSVKPLFAAGYGGGSSPLVIMGGGYDPCEDFDNGTKNHNCTTAGTKGNKVYVLDATDGTVQRSFDTLRAVVADATIVTGADGKAMYAYTADLGGNVYRIDFGNGAPASWAMTRIASLGCASPSACTDSTANRKFMFAPSVATVDGTTYYVMLGSGDREKPLASYVATKNITNYFFAIKDKPGDPTWLASENGNCGANLICLSSLYPILTSATPTDAQLAGKKGWYLGLSSTEQVVTSALTIFGTVYFSTHQPVQYAADACTPSLGTTRSYAVDYQNAQGRQGGDNNRYEHITGDGLPPSPVGGRVKLDNGQVVNFCISCSGEGSIGVREPTSGSSVVTPKRRIYWYIQK